MKTYYIDCEFDGHAGPLLSIALVPNKGPALYVRTDVEPKDPWVIQNVMPYIDQHKAQASACVEEEFVGSVIRSYIGQVSEFSIVADSPVDIWRFCKVLSTNSQGWQNTIYDRIYFEVINQEYPALGVKHNAYWDAYSLKEYCK